MDAWSTDNERREKREEKKYILNEIIRRESGSFNGLHPHEVVVEDHSSHWSRGEESPLGSVYLRPRNPQVTSVVDHSSPVVSDFSFSTLIRKTLRHLKSAHR